MRLRALTSQHLSGCDVQSALSLQGHTRVQIKSGKSRACFFLASWGIPSLSELSAGHASAERLNCQVLSPLFVTWMPHPLSASETLAFSSERILTSRPRLPTAEPSWEIPFAGPSRPRHLGVKNGQGLGCSIVPEVLGPAGALRVLCYTADVGFGFVLLKPDCCARQSDLPLVYGKQWGHHSQCPCAAEHRRLRARKPGCSRCRKARELARSLLQPSLLSCSLTGRVAARIFLDKWLSVKSRTAKLLV